MATKIYLYIKEIPGLKYLGITSKEDYNKYLGSGVYWKNHIKAHNLKAKDISTTILLETEDKDIIKFWGLYYSKIWNVVESEEWANLIPEEGGNENFGIRFKKTKNKRKTYIMPQSTKDEISKKLKEFYKENS